jgi:L-iditol 2-dehydrogenase
MIKRIVVKNPSILSIENLNNLQPHEEQVVVKVKYCGVCGSDIAVYKNKQNNVSYFGHEFSGIVISKGNKVKDLQIGDRVTTGVIKTCGYCNYCRNKQFNYCKNLNNILYPGGLAEECLVFHTSRYKFLTKFPPQIDFLNASLHEPISCVLRILDKANITYGNTVVILGLGSIGVISGLLIKKLYNVNCIYGIDVNSKRLEVAKNLGFNYVINPKITDCPKFIEEQTNGIGADVIIDATGNAESILEAIKIARVGGTIVLAGVPYNFVSFYPGSVFRKELIIKGAKGSFPYLTSQGISKALLIIQDNVLPIEKIVTTYSFKNFDKAFLDMIVGKVLKPVIKF